MRIKKGFTLIEVLMVVAIISLLVSIAIPNYMESIVRAKVARTTADMTHVDRMLIAYEMDSGEFPEDDSVDPFGALSVLTTPVAYISALPEDVCRVRGDPNFGKTFFYAVRDGHYSSLLAESAENHGVPSYAFGLAGYGPDGMFSHGESADTVPYDATNGTISTGNIWRFGP
jgi:prepilin-type N-terminal cleavage/methylation domain-containing protein